VVERDPKLRPVRPGIGDRLRVDQLRPRRERLDPGHRAAGPGLVLVLPRRDRGDLLDGVSDTVPGTTSTNTAFYQALAAYVHSHMGGDAEVVFNFGQNPASGWMLSAGRTRNADLVVTFEGSYNTPGSNPYTAGTQASWERAYPAGDFAALVYDAPDASACTSLATQRLGYAYVGTWYDSLPPFWNSFLSAC
jgi:hypothetical protein